jgi:hypothetical protein
VILALLLAHAGLYAFLTDDAFISFRYARNLSEGHGLVFNPGQERVEGYTNFLWVLLVAGGITLGLSPGFTATTLSLAATVGIWALVVAFSHRFTRDGRRHAWILLPALLLAITRSFAVWSTGGLETRLFELLMVAGTFRLVVEQERIGRGEWTIRPWAALFFALGTLTRPDGLLITASAFGVVVLFAGRRLWDRRRWFLTSTVLYGVLVGGHFLFRYLYYGTWLPNTYYAKVDGHTWWEMGLPYLETFVLEYAVYLWVPFLVAGVLYHLRRSPFVPILFGAVMVPHALYIASIGGDHFEFRPLDLYFPFLYLLVFFGALHLARDRWTQVAVAAGLAIVLAAIIELPLRSHLEFSGEYRPGFPGKKVAGQEFLDPERGWLSRLPGFRSLAARHRDRVRWMTARFGAIRQEEHRMFLLTAVRQGEDLVRAVEKGYLPADTHIAVSSVGAIPYITRFPVLDRLGLTDARVAHSEFQRLEILAHGKSATREYARERGVDLWSADPVHLLWRIHDPAFPPNLIRFRRRPGKGHFARIGSDRVLLAYLPQGVEEAHRRFPALQFRDVHDDDAIEELIGGMWLP